MKATINSSKFYSSRFRECSIRQFCCTFPPSKFCAIQYHCPPSTIVFDGLSTSNHSDITYDNYTTYHYKLKVNYKNLLNLRVSQTKHMLKNCISNSCRQYINSKGQCLNKGHRYKHYLGGSSLLGIQYQCRCISWFRHC